MLLKCHSTLFDLTFSVMQKSDQSEKLQRNILRECMAFLYALSYGQLDCAVLSYCHTADHQCGVTP